MSEYEIRYLMVEFANSSNLASQYWMAITSALLMIAYLAGGELDKNLRKLVVTIYSLLSFSVIVWWCNLIYSLYEYGILLSSLNLDPMVSIPVLSHLSVPASLICMAGGSIGSILYFLKKAKENNGT